MRRALLIYNPNAGRFPPAEAARRTVKVLRTRGWEIDACATRDAEHVTELAAGAAESGLDALIVAGGDGSVGRAVTGLAGSGTALGVLPTGTANVWAQELGLPRIGVAGVGPVIENAELLAGSRVKNVDVGLTNDEPFLLWTGIGLDALVVRSAERRRSHLKKLFVLPEYFARALSASSRWPGAEIHVTGTNGPDEQEFEFSGRIQLAVVTNIRRYAGGYAVLSPAAAVDDGEMDLWVFRGRGPGAALRNAWNLLRGAHVNDPEARRMPFRKITIETENPVPMHRDGEAVPDTRRIEISVCRHSLKILAPRHAPSANGRTV